VTTEPGQPAAARETLDLDEVAGLSWWDRVPASRRRLFIWLLAGWLVAAVVAWQARSYYRHQNAAWIVRQRGGSTGWSLFEGTEVSFRGPAGSFSFQELDHLKELDHLTSLELPDTTITDKKLAFLRDLPDLKHLELKGALITDDGLQHLLGLSKLESLSLGKTNITDSGLHMLAKLPALKHLQLESSSITSAGVDQLMQRLPKLDKSQINPTAKAAGRPTLNRGPLRMRLDDGTSSNP
jgi:hypothetical protein